jgi:hypothetical protein
MDCDVSASLKAAASSGETVIPLVADIGRSTQKYKSYSSSEGGRCAGRTLITGVGQDGNARCDLPPTGGNLAAVRADPTRLLNVAVSLGCIPSCSANLQSADVSYDFHRLTAVKSSQS